MKTLKERRPKVYQLLTELGCEFKGIVEIDLENIYIDQGIYPREKTDFERVNMYAESLENGEEFPPIIVADTIRDIYSFPLLDGNHRYYAHKQIGKKTITAEIWEVPENLYPIVAQAVNTEEGNIDTPLTPAEKKKAILRDWEILAHIPKIVRKEKIAQLLRTSVHYVEDVLSKAGIIKSEKEKLIKRAEELKEKGLSISEIAKELGKDKSTISRWLNKVAKFSQQKNATPQPTPQNLTPDQTPVEEQPQPEPDWSDWNEYQPEEDNIDWDATGWNEYEEETHQEEPKKSNAGRKPKEKKLLHPNHILERNKDAIWDAIIEIEYHFGEDKAEEILEEIYFAYKERKHKGLTIYKDRRARYEAYERQ